MKKLISICIALSMLTAFAVPSQADYTGGRLEQLFSGAALVFDGAGSSGYDKASVSEEWGWSPAAEQGMNLSTYGGIDFLEFYKSSSLAEGGNLVVGSGIAAATSKENCDFAVISFITMSDFESGKDEHIYTLYGDSSNTSGKEILKFKYENGGILPCTAADQNKDEYAGTPICGSEYVPVRIFLIREGDELHYIYQVKGDGWKTAYEGSTAAERFDGGLGTIRVFVKFGTEGKVTGLGNLQIYAGSLGERPARYMEKLNRGLAAMQTDSGIYLSWRLLGTEEYSTSFDVFRNGEKIASVSDSTNYIDYNGSADDEYAVAPSGDEPREIVKAFGSGENYFDIPLSQPPAVTLPDGTVAEYTPWDATVGDLDGDGEYEIIQRWDAPRRHAGQSGYTGGVILDAYKLDGTLLWRIDLGVNIRCNTEQVFSVYDYNCDGIAEIAAKTAPGSVDGTGRFVTEASLLEDIKNADNSADYRNSNGTVLDGSEYYTVFDGRNGKALDTIYYPIPRGEGNDFLIWGDNYGHRSEKYFDAPAYLDGVHPYIVLWRGIYSGQIKYGPGRTGAAALRMDENNRLSLEYTFDTMEGQAGYTAGNEAYIGQGNHNISVGDVDGDGLDEIISGNLCLDDDLSALWCSGRGHGDAQHLGNYDPTTDGLEYMTVHENSPYGMTVYNASTGEELLHIDGTGDTGRGLMANVGSGGYYQVWGAGTYQCNGGSDFTGTNLSGQSYNFRIFWDGDTFDELLDADDATANHTPVITSYNSSTGTMEEIFRCSDAETINTTKATVALTADILGDWREEVIAVTEDLSALRIFVSPIYTENKLYTLMHDSQYRQSVAWQHEYYNQPPHIGFYLSGDNDEYDERAVKPNIVTAEYVPSEYEAPVYVESGVLKQKKVQSSDNIIDMDGDYYHAYEYICTTGTTSSVGNTTLSLSSKRYAYAASANPHHASVLRSSGVERKDGRFIVFAANGDASAKLTVTGEKSVTETGALHLDFAVPSNYSNNGTADRGGNDVSISVGNELTFYYSWEQKTLSLNGKLIHTYADEYEAQRWTSLDVGLDCEKGAAAVNLVFPDGSVYSENAAISPLRAIGSVSASTLYWGTVLLDNITLYSADAQEHWDSVSGFTTHSFEALSGEFAFDMDIIPYELSDGVIGFAAPNAEITWYDKFNLSIRITAEGLIEAYNGSGYSAVSEIKYSPNKKYSLHIEGDTVSKSYSAWITDESGGVYLLADSYAFRASAPSAEALGEICACGGDGESGGKFAVSGFEAYQSVPRLDSAERSGSTLTLCGKGEMRVYAAALSGSGEILKVYIVDFTGYEKKELVIDVQFSSVKLFVWDALSCRPLEAVRNI